MISLSYAPVSNSHPGPTPPSSGTPTNPPENQSEVPLSTPFPVQDSESPPGPLGNPIESPSTPFPAQGPESPPGPLGNPIVQSSAPPEVQHAENPPDPRSHLPEMPSFIPHSHKAIVESLKEQLDKFTTVLMSLRPELRHVTIFSKAIRKAVTGLDPIAQAVQSCVNDFCEQITAQGQSHDGVLLARQMAETVHHIQSVGELLELKDVILPLRKFDDLMEETVNNLHRMCESPQAKISLRSIGETKIDFLNVHYASFREYFDRSLQSDQTTDRKRKKEMKELYRCLFRGGSMVEPPAPEGCFPGTREKILEGIASETVEGEGVNKNVIWICGGPGSGKSTISSSVKSQLCDEGQLVTYFRFGRNQPTTTATALWSNVAYSLAELLPSVRRQILRLKNDNRLNLSPPMVMFKNLIEEPLLNITGTQPAKPLVIVIDALDESGGLEGKSSPDRKALLEAIKLWPKLPGYIKLLITSREDDDIIRALSHISTPIEIRSGRYLMDKPEDEASSHALNDIRKYLQHRFQELRAKFSRLPDGWPGNQAIEKMAQLAAGIFLWAVAAVQFIDCYGEDPRVPLNSIISQSPLWSGLKPLYDLYTIILEASFGRLEKDAKERLQYILGVMVVAQRPLTDTEYTELDIPYRVNQEALTSCRNGLRSVITDDAELRFAHRSFDDFLISEQCPSEYRIQLKDSHYILTRLCVNTMTTDLHFNMCSLTTSYLKNASDIDIEASISPLLAYSCRFWADHLYFSHKEARDETLMNEVKAMISDKLLYWFEAMSFLNEINRVSGSLSLVLRWYYPLEDKFSSFIEDARRFIKSFGQPIAQSAPHIYISALPFAPKNSPVAERFLPRFPNVLDLSTGRFDNWPVCVYTSEHHKAEALCVAFSRDGKQFVSGSRDKTICVCDSETGIRISALPESSSEVFRVSYDTEGTCVWASSCGDGEIGEIIGWDVESGERTHLFAAGVPEDRLFFCRLDLENVRNIVSVSHRQEKVALWSIDNGDRQDALPDKVQAYFSSFSPDGRYMACAGRDDTTVKIWDLAMGLGGIKEILPTGPHSPLKHTKPISTLSFSVDGEIVVSGSLDGTILFWDVATGNTIGPRLDTGMGRLDAVAYSSKGKRVVVASSTVDRKFGTVTVWDTSRHEAILGPLDDHTLWINEIVMSHNGQWALSASWDGTVRLWDVCTRNGASVSNCHKDIPNSVALSPDGERLATFGGDKTIRIWDANTGVLLDFTKARSRDNQIIFTLDGRKTLAYGSPDGTVSDWSPRTGAHNVHQDLPYQNDRQLITYSSNGVLRIRNLKDGAEIKEESLQIVHNIAPSPDGLRAVVCDDANLHYYVQNAIMGRQLSPSFIDQLFLSEDRVAYSPNGQFFAAAHKASSNGESTFRVWNTEANEELTVPVLTVGNTIDCLAFSPDNRHIAFSYVSPPDSEVVPIYVWDVTTRQLVSGSWKGHTHPITALSFSVDGEKLVSGSKDGQLRIWNMDCLFGKSQVPHGFLDLGTDMEDGWVKDGRGNLLFWVPKDHRTKLTWPGNIAVIGHSGTSTRLNFDKFRYAEKWAECFVEKDLGPLGL